MSKRRRQSWLVRGGCIITLTVVGAWVGGCGSAPVADDNLVTVETPPLEAREATPALQQMRWVLGMLNEKAGAVAEDEANARFAPSFLAKVPVPVLQQVSAGLAAEHAPFEAGETEVDEPLRMVLQVRTRDGLLWRISIGVEEAEPHLISGLLLQAVPVEALNPATPVGERAVWVMKLLQGEVACDAPTVGEALDPSFVEVVPVEAVVQGVEGLKAMAPFEVVSALPESAVSGSLIVKAADGTRLMLVLAVAGEPPYRLTGLRMMPAPADDEVLPTSWDEIEAAMAAWAERSTLYVASIDPVSGACSPIRANGDTAPMAIGSTFKLYILAALADAVADGRMRWEQDLAIDEGRKSLPSGVMQTEAAGTTFALRAFADKMISISDNTATDHLLFAVGREAVEARVASSGHQAPERNRPFMSTREMFVLKLGHDAASRDAYAAADEAERRRILDALSAEPLPALVEAASWTTPRNIDALEWFASGEDLCKVYGGLVARREEPAVAPVFDVLAINDGGLRADSDHWRYVGFKGGSEPGVFYLAYLLQDADGRWFTVQLGWNDASSDMPVGANPMTLARAAVQVLTGQ